MLETFTVGQICYAHLRVCIPSVHGVDGLLNLHTTVPVNTASVDPEPLKVKPLDNELAEASDLSKSKSLECSSLPEVFECGLVG